MPLSRRWTIPGRREGPLDPARAGMGDHARGLVDHQHVLVLVHDPERHVLGQEAVARGRRDHGLHALARLQPVRRLDRVAVDADAALGDQTLHAYAGELRQPAGQPPIEPRPGRVGLHHLGPVALAAHVDNRGRRGLSGSRRAR